MKVYPEKLWPIIYLSGYLPTVSLDQERHWLKKSGCKYRCYSFAYTCPGAFYYMKRTEDSLNVTLDKNIGVMMDSGAFSFQKFMHNVKERKKIDNVEKLRDETIDLYVDYCKTHGKEWDFYINFDYVRHAPTVYEIQKRLEKRGIRPTPVFHGDAGLDWLERYGRDGYKHINVGKGKVIGRGDSWKNLSRYFDQVFNIAEKYGMRIHGLAVTSLTFMFQFPFYSVDSATWVKLSANGRIAHVDLNRGTIGHVHVTENVSKTNPSYNRLTKAGQKAVRDTVEKNGFSFKKVRTNNWVRAMYNAYVFSNEVMKFKKAIQETKVNWGTIPWLV